MGILYLHTAPSPKIEGTDAVFNESAMLRMRFGGSELSLFPFPTPSSVYPRFLYGWHQVLKLSKLQTETTINHIFSPGLYYYPVFNLLTKPLVYSVTASVQDRDISRDIRKLKNLSHIVLSNDRDYNLLDSVGFKNITLIRPAIDTSAFEKNYLPSKGELVLMMGSAPWELNQFRTKGIDLLLEAVKRLPYLKLVFLLRGTYEADLVKRVTTLDVGHQVEIINKKVDVNAVLGRVHGTILLAENANLVKSYPHSLIESLAAGKPVITSRSIAMSDYIIQNKCGLSVDSFSLESLMGKINQFEMEYKMLSSEASRVGGDDFVADRMLADMKFVYEGIIKKIP